MNDKKTGQFVPGTHWRKSKPFWERDWCIREYIKKGRSAGDIAKQFSVTDIAIYFWLRRHKIPRRDISEARKLKHWGSKGKANGMYGRRRWRNPNWKGGSIPERAAFYASLKWKRVAKKVRKRDGGICQRCGAKGRYGEFLVLHHIISFSVTEFRAKLENLISLCVDCHKFVHSKRNTKKELIKSVRRGFFW